MSQSTGGSRRRLPKSKTGCRTCKKRKVKCDEGLPSCRNCVKHAVECDFVRREPELSSPLPSPSVTPTSQCGDQSGAFTLDDMELLHHYTTSVCLSITADPISRNLWRTNIPQMGFTTPYILKGILSISALHLSRFRPDRRDFYISRALLHYNKAITLASPLITNITVENCVPLFLFSTITNLFAFAKPKNASDLLVAENQSVPDWLYLFRGVRALMDAQGDRIHQSFFGPMFEEGIKMHKFWHSHKFENKSFEELEDNIQAETNRDPSQLSALLDAIDALKRSFALHYAHDQPDEHRTRGVLLWLPKIGSDYITMVANGDNAALCVLAFFCILLKRLNFLWWMEGWGLHLIERIYSRLDETHKLWIWWPMEEIGWVSSV